ncbi:MAG: 30S ribosomal protein S6 [Pelagibacteraceae bacterium]|nr:30S ribosomal protein S6 [Pelagibacteraceae bacterium]|tara:strand:+ start:18265 stop:18591 length:327 start_codon:yes stop_codon:yes gene_type:complete
MNKFEAVLLLSPDISSTLLKKEIDAFLGIISSNEGKIINEEDWGLRDLSYKIANHKKAFYQFFQIELIGSKIQVIKKSLSQNDKILRHLFVKVEDHQELPTKLQNEKK